MAKFLQETLRESGLQANAHIVGSDEFKEFFRKVTALNSDTHRLRLTLFLGSPDWRVTYRSGYRECGQILR